MRFEINFRINSNFRYLDYITLIRRCKYPREIFCALRRKTKRREHMSKVRQKQMKRRAEIIEALIPVISSRDFSELSVGELCAAAGISVGSFYHYFSKKSDILVGLLALIDEYLEENVYDRLTDESALENLRLFAHEWAGYVRDHGLERSRLISATASSNVDLQGSPRSSFMKLEELISEGQLSGEITKSRTARELTEHYLLALRGVTTDWSRCSGEYPLVERADSFMDFFLRAFEAEKGE